MQEDLSLYGNERNYLNTYFNIGILLGTIPSQLIQLEHIRPSVWIPSCEITWSILVIGTGFAKNIETLYGLRFLIGFAEACVYNNTTSYKIPSILIKVLRCIPRVCSPARRMVWHQSAGKMETFALLWSV